MCSQNNFVSDEMMKTKAFLLLNEKHSENSTSISSQLKLSNGWLHRFKTHHNFKRFYSNGESFGLCLKILVIKSSRNNSKAIQIHYQ